MGEVLDWVKFCFEVVFAVVGFAFNVWMVFMVYRMLQTGFKAMNPVLARTATPSFSIFLRRIYCKHHVVARTRDPYGRHFTQCARCGIDVNADRPRGEWR